MKKHTKKNVRRGGRNDVAKIIRKCKATIQWFLEGVYLPDFESEIADFKNILKLLDTLQPGGRTFLVTLDTTTAADYARLERLYGVPTAALISGAAYQEARTNGGAFQDPELVLNLIEDTHYVQRCVEKSR